MMLYWCFSSRISACNTFRSSAAALGQYRIKKVVQAILLNGSFRKTVATVTAVLAVVTAVLLISSAIDIFCTGTLDLAENVAPAGDIYSVETVQAHFRVIAPVVYGFLASVVLGLILRLGGEEKPEIAKPSPIEKKAPANPKAIFAVRIAVAVIAVTLIVLGIANGGMYDVFVKAKKICMECIGLG